MYATLEIKRAAFSDIRDGSVSLYDEGFMDGCVVPQWELQNNSYQVKIKPLLHKHSDSTTIVAYLKPVKPYYTCEFETIFGFQCDCTDFTTDKIVAVGPMDDGESSSQKKNHIILTIQNDDDTNSGAHSQLTPAK